MGDSLQYHLSDGGNLVFSEILDYGYFEAPVFICSCCGMELDINDGDYIGTLEEYEYFKTQGWQAEHGKPRRLYPNYPKGIK